MMSLPSASGALFSSFIVSLHTMQLKRPISGLLSSFNDILGARTGSLPLRLLPSLPGDKTCSIFRIGRVSLGLFLAGKMSHRNAVPFDGPPSFRRPMWPRFYRHHFIRFVGIVVGHFRRSSTSRANRSALNRSRLSLNAVCAAV